LGYSLEYQETALRQLRKLDRQVARRIVDYLDEVAALDDPRGIGSATIACCANCWMRNW